MRGSPPTWSGRRSEPTAPPPPPAAPRCRPPPAACGATAASAPAAVPSPGWAAAPSPERVARAPGQAPRPSPAVRSAPDSPTPGQAPRPSLAPRPSRAAIPRWAPRRWPVGQPPAGVAGFADAGSPRIGAGGSTTLPGAPRQRGPVVTDPGEGVAEDQPPHLVAVQERELEAGAEARRGVQPLDLRSLQLELQAAEVDAELGGVAGADHRHDHAAVVVPAHPVDGHLRRGPADLRGDRHDLRGDPVDPLGDAIGVVAQQGGLGRGRQVLAGE